MAYSLVAIRFWGVENVNFNRKVHKAICKVRKVKTLYFNSLRSLRLIDFDFPNGR
jgi:hypothetical protein